MGTEKCLPSSSRMSQPWGEIVQNHLLRHFFRLLANFPTLLANFPTETSDDEPSSDDEVGSVDSEDPPELVDCDLNLDGYDWRPDGPTGRAVHDATMGPRSELQ